MYRPTSASAEVVTISVKTWEQAVDFLVGVWRCLIAIPGRSFHVFFLYGYTRPAGTARQSTTLLLMMHIGKRIKEVFDSQPKGRTAEWFARQLNCNRTNIYDIFRRSAIDTELLMRISIALNHDFFEELSKEYKASSQPR